MCVLFKNSNPLKGGKTWFLFFIFQIKRKWIVSLMGPRCCLLVTVANGWNSRTSIWSITVCIKCLMERLSADPFSRPRHQKWRWPVWPVGGACAPHPSRTCSKSHRSTKRDSFYRSLNGACGVFFSFFGQTITAGEKREELIYATWMSV